MHLKNHQLFNGKAKHDNIWTKRTIFFLTCSFCFLASAKVLISFSFHGLLLVHLKHLAWWCGYVWIPENERDCYLRLLVESQITKSNHQLTISGETRLEQEKNESKVRLMPVWSGVDGHARYIIGYSCMICKYKYIYVYIRRIILFTYYLNIDLHVCYSWSGVLPKQFPLLEVDLKNQRSFAANIALMLRPRNSEPSKALAICGWGPSEAWPF